MIKLMQYLAIVLLGVLFFFNFFRITPQAILLAIYPYLIGFTMIILVSMGIFMLVENNVAQMITKGIVLLSFIFILYSFVQIYRNATLISGYQQARSRYMDQLMKISNLRDRQEERLKGLQRGVARLIEINTGMPVSYYNNVAVLPDGVKVIDEMIETISNATHHIHVEFFIIRDDEIGRKFKEVLMAKAQEGVKVRLIYDGLGSRNISGIFKKRLKESGVEIAVFNGGIRSAIKGKLNHRNHRKIVVVDGITCYIGGFNIGNEYLGRNEEIGKWSDLHIKVEGELVNWAQKIFLGDWYYITKEKILDKEYFPTTDIQRVVPAQLITSGFDTHWNEISQLYFTMIAAAKERVYIATPYLILNDSLLKALQTAAIRGVDVKIVIPKVPDLAIVGYANEVFFEKLLKAGVKIYLYEEGFLHSKVFLTDDNLVSIGSANLNTRSLYLDYEVNAVIYDKEVAYEIRQLFKEYLEKSQEVKLKDYSNISIGKKIRLLIGRIITPFS